MTAYNDLKSQKKILGVDIGGMTADYMSLRDWKIDLDNTSSGENGIITLYSQLQKACLSRFARIIDESDIDDILKGTYDADLFEEDLVNLIDKKTAEFVSRFLGRFRENGIDLSTTHVVFMGGGSVLLKKYLEQSPLLRKKTFIDDIHANAKGYRILNNISLSARRSKE